MRLRAATSLTFLAIGLTMSACAPRIATNLYARWSLQDEARRVEMAREEKVRAEVERRMGVSSDAPAAVNRTTNTAPSEAAPSEAAPSEAALPEAAPDTSSPESAEPSAPKSWSNDSANSTPPITKTRTATATRAVKPIFQEMEEEEEEEETIY